jgi:hypothetical protein
MQTQTRHTPLIDKDFLVYYTACRKDFIIQNLVDDCNLIYSLLRAKFVI